MGQEARCKAKVGRRLSEGTAYLEATELLFRGDFKLAIPFKDVRSVESRGGKLTVRLPKGIATFELGAEAEKWALKIRYPRGLLDKLDVKPDSKVAVIGVKDAGFLKDLHARTKEVSEKKPLRDSDLVFFGAEKQEDLKRLLKLRESIKPSGAIWVVWPKGQKSLREDDVRDMGPKVGLVDVKVVSFSETLSALKMVIPLSLR